MNNEFLLGVESRLHGYHTRIKELHFSAKTHAMHTVLDSFDKQLLEFEDSIMEDAQSMFGVIGPGEINPVLPQETDPVQVLRALRALLAEMKDTLVEKCYTGILNQVDDFWHTVNKTIYLINMC